MIVSSVVKYMIKACRQIMAKDATANFDQPALFLYQLTLCMHVVMTGVAFAKMATPGDIHERINSTIVSEAQLLYRHTFSI